MPRWDRAHLRSIFGFGKWIFLSSIIGFVAAHGEKLLLGGAMTAAGFGVYAIAATLLAALDAAAPNNPVMLAGVDGHAGGYNSQALAQAQDKDGNVVGFNATTLAPGGVFEAFIPYVDLASGSYDLALRYGTPHDSTMRVRKLVIAQLWHDA